MCLLLGLLIRVRIVRVLESSNVESAKAKAPCSKNMMGISFNNGLALILFRKSAGGYFNISRNPATLLILNVRKKERGQITLLPGWDRPWPKNEFQF